MNSTTRGTWRTIVAAGTTAVFLGMVAAGCGGFEGSQGNLEFRYDTDKFSSKRPLALNTSIRINTFVADSDDSDTGVDGGAGDTGTADTGTSGADAGADAGNGGEKESRAVTLTSVSSDDSSIVSVTNVGTASKNTFQLDADQTGTTTINVNADKADGTSVMDSFDVTVKKTKQTELDHVCSTDDDSNDKPVYLTDQEVPVQYDLLSGPDSELTGWGYYPFSVTGSSSASIDKTRQDARYLMVETGTKETTIDVEPDSSVQGDPLSLELKKPAKIDSIKWLGGDSDDAELIGNPDSDAGAFLFPGFEISGDEVCRADVEVNITEKTSDVCSVSVTSFDLEDTRLFSQIRTALRVKQKKEKTCEFDVEVADGSITESVSIDLSQQSN